jgi:hypothetical protein
MIHLDMFAKAAERVQWQAGAVVAILYDTVQLACGGSAALPAGLK